VTKTGKRKKRFDGSVSQLLEITGGAEWTAIELFAGRG